MAKGFDSTMLTFIIIGAVNWGLVGFFQFDLVGTLFGGMGSVLSRTIYAIIGVAGLYCLSLYTKLEISNREDEREHL